MALTRVNPDWAFGGKLSSDELDAIEENIISALDKRAGQTDTLASDVEVTGETTFTGDTIVDGELELNGVTTVNGPVQVLGDATIDGDVSFGGEFAMGVGPAAEIDRDIAMQNANNVQLATGNVTFSPVRTVTRKIPLGAVVAESAAGSLGTSGSDQDLQELTSAITTRSWTALTFAAAVTANAFARYWVVDLARHVPNGATITEVSIELRGNTGHAALPAQMPGLSVRREGGTGVSLHSAGSRINDASASTAAYQSTHGIIATCNQNNVVDKSQYTYYAMILNEGSTNAIAGLIVTSMTVTFTVPSIAYAP